MRWELSPERLLSQEGPGWSQRPPCCPPCPRPRPNTHLDQPLSRPSLAFPLCTMVPGTAFLSRSLGLKPLSDLSRSLEAFQALLRNPHSSGDTKVAWGTGHEGVMPVPKTQARGGEKQSGPSVTVCPSPCPVRGLEQSASISSSVHRARDAPSARSLLAPTIKCSRRGRNFSGCWERFGVSPPTASSPEV